MTNAKVSVILPTFNRTASLGAACESVLNQSFADLQLIIIDDASTEDIEAVLRSLGDARIRYVRREQNGGAAAARNTGLIHADGDFIAFQDSDDIWLPGKLARQLSLFERLPSDVGVVTGIKILYGRDRSFNYGPGRVVCVPPAEGRLSLDEDQVRRFLDTNRISLQNALFRRTCFPETVWFDPCVRANVDWDFTVRLVRHTKVYEDNYPVVLAFVSQDSVSTDRRRKLTGLIRVLKKNREQFRMHPDIHAKKLLQLARVLFKIGKRRWAARFLVAAIRKHPLACLPWSRFLFAKRERPSMTRPPVM